MNSSFAICIDLYSGSDWPMCHCAMAHAAVAAV